MPCWTGCGTTFFSIKSRSPPATAPGPWDWRWNSAPIESGKTAGLAIVDGDPLEDFRVIGSRVAALFMNGKLVINNCGLKVES
jgi:hypothetical protein